MKLFKAAHALLFFVATMGVTPMGNAQSYTNASASNGPCEKVVQGIFGYIARSSVFDLQIRLQAHELVTRILNKEPTPGTGWREGNAYWEEAYAVYYPSTYQFMKEQVVRDVEHQQAVWPKRIDLDLCNKYMTLANSKEGKAVIANNVANAMEDMLKDVEKIALSTNRLQTWIDTARHEVSVARQAANREKSPISQSLYLQAQHELQAYENSLTKNLKSEILSDTPEGKQRATEYFSAMNARNKDKLVDIAQRFRNSAK